MGDLDLNQLLLSPEFQAAGVLILALVIGYAITTALSGVLARAVARTESDLDDHLLALARRPAWVTAVVLALEWAGDRLRLTDWQQTVYDASLATVALVVWTVALVRAADAILVTLNEHRSSWLRGRASGLMRYAARMALVLLAVYLLMGLWGLDLRAWQISAGVVGAVLAFAAQDSLGNLISGVFIMADRPLRIGDVVRVDARVRGRVTAIGWRSTRLLTRDNVEINVPNATLSQSRVLNECGGPFTAIRVACEFRVEHGRTADEVAAAVLPGASELPEVVSKPGPDLRFRGPSESGMRYALRVWVGDPGRLLEAKDAVNTHVLRRLRAAGIGLAYPTHEVALGGPLDAALRVQLARRLNLPS